MKTSTELCHLKCSHCKLDWARIPSLFEVCTNENIACWSTGSHPPWLVLCAFWSSQCSAGPLRISGCICNGPVVIPSIWCVVADWPVFTPPPGNKGFGPVGFALSTML